MARWLTNYLIFELLVLVVLVAGTLWLRRFRLRDHTRVPDGYQPTQEVFTDPTTGKKQRVWYNPSTGERFYQVIEDQDPGH